MTEIAAHFASKVERAASFYEERAKLVDAAYLAQVEKLARRTSDKTLADFFRDTVRPARIAWAIDGIRWHLENGQIVEADQAIESLKAGLDLVEAHLRYPYFQAGVRVATGGKKGAIAKYGTPAERSDILSSIRESFAREYAKGISKSAAESITARAFSCSTRTVRKARTGK